MHEYSGDINIENGGQWIDLDNWADEYADCIRVTDLDSAIGFDGAIMIEHVTILLDKKHWLDAIACCGYSVGDLLAMDSDCRRYALAEALLSYGRFDPDDAWDGSHYMETVQTTEDGPMSFDGWKADKRVLSENLDGYIKAVHLN